MPDYFDAPGGTAVDIDALTPGDIVYDGSGAAFRIEEELEQTSTLGKSAFFEEAPAVAAADAASESLSKALREELSKALADDNSEAKDAVFSKALEQIEKFEVRATEAETIAKSERNLRLTREYIAKAADYNVPVKADELGPVLLRAHEALSYEDCAVIHKALSGAGAALRELGVAGNADNADPMAQIDAEIDAEVAKSTDGTSISKAAATVAHFSKNTDSYDEYRRDRLGLRG